jgi:hypothetical protein
VRQRIGRLHEPLVRTGEPVRVLTHVLLAGGHDVQLDEEDAYEYDDDRACREAVQ